MSTDLTRRDLLRNSTMTSAALALAAWPIPMPGAADKKSDEPEVTATEDLMREHGVIRRALLVYVEVIPKLRSNAGQVDARQLHDTAQLFRTFAEDYHEKMLEEEHIFPVVHKMNAELAKYVDTLKEQHQRGREITDYILAVSRTGKVGVQHVEALAKVFETLGRMYENHAAREDTIVFPAWKKNYNNKQLDELSDQFEDIEHKMFGKDGFEDAEKKISDVEQALGFADLRQFTAPRPPAP